MARAAEKRENLAALIAAIEEEAYERGRADARKELLDLLISGDRSTAASKRADRGRVKEPSKGRQGGKHSRAPRGAARRFVERALRDRPALRAAEIPALAADEVERSIGLGSIRTELSNGRRQGRYAWDNGRWSSTETTGRGTVETEPAVASSESGEEPHAASSGGGGTAESDPGEGEARGTLGLNL